MSRVSLNRRLAAILETAERIDPQALAVHRMLPATRLRYDLWRAACDRVHARYSDPGSWYGAFIADDPAAVTPEPCGAVARALSFVAGPVVVPADADFARLYADMIGPE